MRKSVIGCLVLLALLTACGLPYNAEYQPAERQQAVAEETSPDEDVPVTSEAPPLLDVPVSSSCTNTSQCADGQLCINNQCGSLTTLYQTDCPQKCTMKEIEIETSDGQTFTIPPGQGSYTAAGALSWTTQRLPPYCPTETVTVPFVITKKSYSTVYGEEMVAVPEGETSTVITHPVISRIAFTLTVKNVVEECSNGDDRE